MIRVLQVNLEDPISSVVDLSSTLIDLVHEMIDQVEQRHVSSTAPDVNAEFDNTSHSSDDDSVLVTEEISPDMALLGLPLSFSGKNITCFNSHDAINNELPKNKNKKRKVEKKRQKHDVWDEGINRNRIRKKYSRSEKYAFLFPQRPPDLDIDDKYWDQRYRLMSRFDHGVKLDPESWYSITPEIIANHITERCTQLARHHRLVLDTALDGFCGCGGNAISLAKAFKRVIAVDLDPLKVTSCKHNAGIYSVGENMHFLNDDIYHVLHRLLGGPTETSENQSSSNEEDREVGTDDKEDLAPPRVSSKPPLLPNIFHRLFPSESHLMTSASVSDGEPSVPTVDILFLAPPWGGPEYSNAQSFNLRTMLPSGDGFELVKLAATECKNIVLMIPRNTSRKHLRQLQGYVELPCIVEEVYLYMKHKMTVVYIGELFASSIPI